MKFVAAFAAICFSVPAFCSPVDGELSKTIVRTGEVISSRPYVQPKLGFELLIRHGGGIYICSISQETRYGYNGAPNVESLVVNGCLSEGE